MDPLSQTISLLQPRAVAWRLIEAHAPATLRLPTTELAAFGQVIEGAGRVRLADGFEFDVAAGDFLLMAAPRSWTVTFGAGGEPVDLKAAASQPGRLLSRQADPVVTRLMAGAFAFSAAADGLLERLMPTRLHIPAAQARATRLEALLRQLGEEAVAERPGRALVLDRLLEILLVEVLRRQPPEPTAQRPGLLAGLADARLGEALRAIHADAQRPWTVGALARAAGMSRSAFAARFCAVVGVPPMDYVSGWRLGLAKAALAASDAPMAQVAELAGYASVSAFSTAFSRATGRSPTAFSREARQAARMDEVEDAPLA